MQYSLGQAAKRLGIGKSTLSRHRQEGRFSAEKDDNGVYVIEESELARAYPDRYRQNDPQLSQKNNTGQIETHSPNYTESPDTRIWRERSKILEDERDDLRRRLDQESEERRRLTAMLTDQREKKSKGFWARLFGRDG